MVLFSVDEESETGTRYIVFRGDAQDCFHHLVEIRNDGDGGETMQRSSLYSLIFVILNHGSSEEGMDAARAAGAAGGTVLHARGHVSGGVERFFGMTIAPEKDILKIVA